MKDKSQHNQDSTIAELKDENILLKADNFALKAANIELTKQNHSFARLILDLQETVKELKDEINRLKGQKARPKFPPANLNKGGKGDGNDNAKKQPPIVPITGIKKIRREEIVINPPNLPEGSRFKGYSDFHVEELCIEALKIKYRLAVYETPSGNILRGRLPFNLNGKHFGPELVAYCLDQYHGRCVTRPQLLEQLLGYGVEVSAGELDNILIVGKDIFHEEKAAVFEAGIAHSDQLNTDDTGARHNGKNGVCTHIGSPVFCYFESTFSKSRINFLEVLRGRYTDYILSEDALLYAFDQDATVRLQTILDDHVDKRFADKDAWNRFLNKKGITKEKDQRIATEAALMGSAIFHGLRPTMGIMSDAAGQFNILIHALCWIHEERHYRKFVALTEDEKILTDGIRDAIWDIYEELKEYKAKPTQELREQIEEDFDGLFNCKTESRAINSLLENTLSRREGLLRVLDYPWLMLHNNDSERDIREYVKKRKISGSTRSELGRKARDTFASLKKTCKKLGVCFWDYLRDRTGKFGQIKPLSDLIAEKSTSISNLNPLSFSELMA